MSKNDAQGSLLDLLGGGSTEVEKVIQGIPESCTETCECNSGEQDTLLEQESGAEKDQDELQNTNKNEIAKKDGKKSFDDAWVVLYAGKTRYVRDLRLKKYEEGALKRALAKEFPEMGVVKVIFNYNDKKKAIVPVVRGDTKGDLF